MWKITIFILMSMLAVTCKSQQVIGEQKGKSELNKEDDPAYFLGTWRFIEKNYMDGNEKKSYPLHECIKKYTWVFEKSGNNIFLTKNYTTGKDCLIKSSSGRILITVNTSSFAYTDLDLKRVEQYRIISRNKFLITYSDILNGQVREIEDIYERQ